jgi:hypothetical protein
MGPVGCTETSVRNFNYSLCNVSEQRSYQLTWNHARCLFSTVDEGNKSTAGRARYTTMWSINLHTFVICQLIKKNWLSGIVAIHSGHVIIFRFSGDLLLNGLKDGQNTVQHDFTSTTSLWMYSCHVSVTVYCKYKHVRFLSPLQFRSSSIAEGQLLTSQYD